MEKVKKMKEPFNAFLANYAMAHNIPVEKLTKDIKQIAKYKYKLYEKQK